MKRLDAVKATLWCPLFHRWHRARLGGWYRYYCRACENLEAPQERRP